MKPFLILAVVLAAGTAFGQSAGCVLSSNPYAPNSTSNPYSPCGSRYSPESINNPYGVYGSRYSPYSPNNPYAVQAPLMVPNDGSTVVEQPVEQTRPRSYPRTTNGNDWLQADSPPTPSHLYTHEDMERYVMVVNLHEQSGSEQESEPYGRDYPAAIDHSVGSRRRRLGFFLGFGLSPPLALAASKHKTPLNCTAGRDR